MHQNGLHNKVWLQLGTEGAFRNLLTEINVGDLPPKSPEFYEMLPSLRSSPIFLFQAREDESTDSFHVVPSYSSKSAEVKSTADTYETFLRNLECNENQGYEGNLPLSPECYHLTKQIVDEGNPENLCDDFQIYLQNEISPTPVDKLYSTLPAKEGTKAFEFPSFDENQRLENMNVAGVNDYKATICPPCEEFSQKEPLNDSSYIEVSRKRKIAQKHGRTNSESSGKEATKFPSKVNRPSHNDIERQRRNDMKARFESLKAVIPELEKLERTPKIQILSRATEYINKLHEEEKGLDNERELERKRNRLLLDKLVQLTNVK